MNEREKDKFALIFVNVILNIRVDDLLTTNVRIAGNEPSQGVVDYIGTNAPDAQAR